MGTTSEYLTAAGLDGWTEHDGGIARTYKTTGWPATLMLVNAIGFCAETAFHHPDLSVSYDSVQVRLLTHDAGNAVTDKDLALARRIEDLALYRPGDDSPLDGPSKPLVQPG